MENIDQKEPMIFDIHVTEGSNYEVGKQRAITFKEHYPDDIAYYTSLSYEYFVRDERSLCITRVTGKPKHMGFSLQNAGRMDGMNEYGLVVSMSSTAYLKPLEGDGCEFWIAIRAILDRCKDVYEAQCLIEEMPLCTNSNIMVADAANNVSIFEVASFSSNKKRISVRNPVGGLMVATNHYVSHEMKEFQTDEHHFWNSEIRYSSVWNSLLRDAPYINEEKIRNLLSMEYPYGPCCHFYSSGMGTLRSMVFDVTDKRLKVSFGPPDMNPWHSVDFDEPVGLQEIVCRYDDVSIDNPEQFWREI